jgi:hypothetical protein
VVSTGYRSTGHRRYHTHVQVCVGGFEAFDGDPLLLSRQQTVVHVAIGALGNRADELICLK